MPKLKVLPLDGWMQSKRCLEMDRAYLKPTIPVYNRNGKYLLGQDCWFEVNGEAFLYDASQFKYELEVLNARRYGHREKAALLAMKQVRLLTKAQARLLYLIYCNEDLRRTTVSVSKHVMKTRKKLSKN